jgi:hypothetical protein
MYIKHMDINNMDLNNIYIYTYEYIHIDLDYFTHLVCHFSIFP